jgi:hypothetical protein
MLAAANARRWRRAGSRGGGASPFWATCWSWGRGRGALHAALARIPHGAISTRSIASARDARAVQALPLESAALGAATPKRCRAGAAAGRRGRRGLVKGSKGSRMAVVDALRNGRHRPIRAEKRTF